MKFKIYGADKCPRCKKVKRALKQAGHEVEEHTAEWHSLPQEGWREREVDFAGFRGMLSRQNEELPVVAIEGDDVWEFITYEEVFDGR